MTRLVMYQVDAFASAVFTGNPAAVVILEEWLTDEMMQHIAAENNLAETAFSFLNGSRRHLRWFTPTQEVDFCGHATMATAHVLASEYDVAEDIVFDTRIGDLRVSLADDRYILDLPCFQPQPIEGLDIPDGIIPDGSLGAFRNFENVYVELADEAAVRGYVPDFPRIALLDPLGLVITARGKTSDFVSRCFFPAAGIPEDPVTGSAHATLVPFWARRMGKDTLTGFQCSRRGGALSCQVADDRVLLTGRAVTFMKAEIFLPE